MLRFLGPCKIFTKNPRLFFIQILRQIQRKITQELSGEQARYDEVDHCWQRVLSAIHRKKFTQTSPKTGNRAETEGQFFTGGSFRKGVQVPTGVLGGAVWGRVQVGWGGGGFALEFDGKREGCGEEGGG